MYLISGLGGFFFEVGIWGGWVWVLLMGREVERRGGEMHMLKDKYLGVEGGSPCFFILFTLP